MRIIMVEFDDSMFVKGGWMEKEDVQPSYSTICVAIGVICEDTESHITLFPYIAPHEVAKGIVIPKSSIKRVRTLKVM